MLIIYSNLLYISYLIQILYIGKWNLPWNDLGKVLEHLIVKNVALLMKMGSCKCIIEITIEVFMIVHTI